MRLRARPSSTGGSILFLALFFVLLMALGAGLLVSNTQRGLFLGSRKAAWQMALPLAEAGVEEALAHLNDSPILFTNGWQGVPGLPCYRKERTFASGRVVVNLYTNKPAYIDVTAYVPVPTTSNEVSRRVIAGTTNLRTAGIEVQDTIHCNAETIDSFDSSDPALSSAGRYDPMKARDRALLATAASSNGKITFAGNLLGYVRTAGGSVSCGGKAGDSTWVQRADTSGIQPGHFSGSYSGTFPKVTCPFTTGLSPLTGTVGTNFFNYMFVDGDYVVSNFQLTEKQKALVTGRVRILVKGGFSMSGGSQFMLGPQASVDIYCDCGSVKVTGSGFVNSTYRGRNLTIHGTPNLKSVEFKGVSDFYGKVYAPQADVVIGGNSMFCGTCKSKSFAADGNARLHCDEALEKGKHLISWWREE